MHRWTARDIGIASCTSNATDLTEADHHPQGVEYVNFEIADQPGENILREGIREGVPKIDAWVAAGKTVLVTESARACAQSYSQLSGEDGRTSRFHSECERDHVVDSPP